MADRMPDEILEHIFAHLWPAASEDSTTQPYEIARSLRLSLLPVCLVNKAWCRVAQELLYCAICLPSFQSLKLLLSTLLRSPGLALLVKQIDPGQWQPDPRNIIPKDNKLELVKRTIGKEEIPDEERVATLSLLSPVTAMTMEDDIRNILIQRKDDFPMIEPFKSNLFDGAYHGVHEEMLALTLGVCTNLDYLQLFVPQTWNSRFANYIQHMASREDRHSFTKLKELFLIDYSDRHQRGTYANYFSQPYLQKLYIYGSLLPLSSYFLPSLTTSTEYRLIHLRLVDVAVTPTELRGLLRTCPKIRCLEFTDLSKKSVTLLDVARATREYQVSLESLVFEPRRDIRRRRIPLPWPSDHIGLLKHMEHLRTLCMDISVGVHTVNYVHGNNPVKSGCEYLRDDYREMLPTSLQALRLYQKQTGLLCDNSPSPSWAIASFDKNFRKKIRFLLQDPSFMALQVVYIDPNCVQDHDDTGYDSDGREYNQNVVFEMEKDALSRMAKRCGWHESRLENGVIALRRHENETN